MMEKVIPLAVLLIYAAMILAAVLRDRSMDDNNMGDEAAHPSRLPDRKE